MRIEIENLDLEQIARSGQCFNFISCKSDQTNDTIWCIPYKDSLLTAMQRGNVLWLSCSEREWKEKFAILFDNDRDYKALGRQILDSSDLHLREAYMKGSGIRILRQDLWEVIISFMISQNNNISRITKSVAAIRSRCGHSILNNYRDASESGEGLSAEERELLAKAAEFGQSVKAFPSAFEISDELLDDTTLGLGYRAPYIKAMCRYTRENPEWLDELAAKDYQSARSELMSHLGIGAKVADCICLFGLGHTEAFPIDTHVKQLMDKYYNGKFEYEVYKENAGIVQQYLFFRELT